jgi:sugar phosphate permease
MQGSRIRPHRVHYAWVIVAVTFAATLITAGLRAAPGVLIVPMEAHFHWSRSVISGAVAVNILVLGALGPFGAAILERFGIRRVVVSALVMMSLGMALSIFVTAPWQLVVLWGPVVGLGTSMTFMVLAATVASRWFAEKRGLVMGILTASTATGQLIFLPLLAEMNDWLGWQAVVLTVAGAALLVAVPVALFMRDRPADLGLAPYGQAGGPVAWVKPAINPARRAIAVLRDGVKDRDFWMIGASFFVCGASTSGLISTHLIPACLDEGVPAVTGASLLAAMGFFNIFGTTMSGWLSDRCDCRKLLAWYYGLRALSLLALPFAFQYNMWGLSAFAVFYGLDWIATVPPTVRLLARRFGEQNVAVYYGWITALHQLGGASIAWLAGVMRVETGDYVSAFIFSGVLCLCASVLVTLIGGQPRPAMLAAAE